MIAWNVRDRGFEIRLVDPATGQASNSIAPAAISKIKSINLDSYQVARSDDGQQLGLVLYDGQTCTPFSGGTSCYPSGDHLILVELQTGKFVEATLPVKGYVSQLAFNQDASQLALVSGNRDGKELLLLDGRDGSLLAQRTLNFDPNLLSFSNPGQDLVLFGSPQVENPGVDQPAPPLVMVVDREKLNILWRETLDDVLNGYWCVESCDSSHELRLSASWSPAVLLSPDRDRLYVVHADGDAISVADLAGHLVTSLQIHKRVSLFERLLALTAGVAHAKGGFEGATKNAVFSPDGSRLYIVGYQTTATPDPEYAWRSETKSLDLQVVDAETGELVDERASKAEKVSISPDGSTLFLYGWRNNMPGYWTEVVDANTLERKARLDGWEIKSVQDAAGKPVLVGAQPSEYSDKFALIDPQSFQVLYSWTERTNASWLVNP
jgi:dipeptidyl aminopeptidase/acylaminoacyl peptidase